VTGSYLAAVLLAALGAVLFGLAAVRQHDAVQATMSVQHGLAEHVRAFWSLVRQPAWLRGAGESAVAGGLHVVALALAPITLIQPIGVIAVPVTVVASALRTHRRPRPTQILGAGLSVVGIGVLTVLLIIPGATPLVLPGWGLVAGPLLVLVVGAVLAILSRGAWPPVIRCITLATAAAALFGLNSILIRTIGNIIKRGLVGAAGPVLWTSVLGLAVALPVGLWAMQSAYLSGSPHIVICVLTLVDPVSAVVGGHLLLHDGVAIGGLTLWAAVGCGVVAGFGVLLLSRDYPVDRPTGAGVSASRR
jgi:hypothetical protein